MDDDAAYRNQHPGSQFQQSLAQHANLGAGTSGTGSPQAQLLHQNIRGGGEQDAELVGPEAGATGAIDLEKSCSSLMRFSISRAGNRPVRKSIADSVSGWYDDKPGIVFGVLSTLRGRLRL